jgi:ribonuclease HI
MLKNTNGDYAETPAAVLDLLVDTHFKDGTSTQLQKYIPDINLDTAFLIKYINKDRILEAIHKFSPYKRPGLDEIHPILLQNAPDILIAKLIYLFRASLTYAYTPDIWNTSKIIFMAKINKVDYELPKSFRPLSLNSFIFKTNERLIDNYFKEEVLIKCPLKGPQHAFRSGLSTESAMHNLITEAEAAVYGGKFCLSVFLDIEGAFDNATYLSIMNALKKFNVHITVQGWINNLLINRKGIMTLKDAKLTKNLTRGVPQGGILSPTLWNLIIDELLVIIENSRLNSNGYADDIVLSYSGSEPNLLVIHTNEVLLLVDQWGIDNFLKFNPDKTVAIMFTNKRKWQLNSKIILGGKEITLSDTVKYLGITLDKKLSWNQHINNICIKSNISLSRCRKALGTTWGLHPKVMLWLYTAVIRPMMSYAVFIWSNITLKSTKISKLEKIQRQACLAITACRHSVSGAALNAILNLPPLKIYLQSVAIKTYYRLMNSPTDYPTKHITMDDITGPLEKGHLGLIKKFCRDFHTLEMPSDKSLPTVNTPQFYKVKDILSPNYPCPQQINCFTDGSRGEEGSGAGVYIINFENKLNNLEIPLGKFATVFQSEIIGIYSAATMLQDTENCNIIIHSDSEASLKAIKKSTSTSKIVNICTSALNKLSKKNIVSLRWVKAHCGIHGNEMADKLAKNAANTPFIGPEPVLPIANCIFKSEIDGWLIREHTLIWNAYNGGQHTKNFIQTPNVKLSKLLLSMTRNNIRTSLAYISGHCNLNRFEYICNRTTSPLCRKCNMERETPVHVLSTCMALTIPRQLFFGYAELPENYIRNLNPYKILKFFKKIGLPLIYTPDP